MCLLGPLNVLSFEKQIYIYIKVQKLSGNICSVKFEVQVLNSEIQFKMAAKKAIFQSICPNKNNLTKFKIASKKLLKPSPNIIVT